MSFRILLDTTRSSSSLLASPIPLVLLLLMIFAVLVNVCSKLLLGAHLLLPLDLLVGSALLRLLLEALSHHPLPLLLLKAAPLCLLGLPLHAGELLTTNFIKVMLLSSLLLPYALLGLTALLLSITIITLPCLHFISLHSRLFSLLPLLALFSEPSMLAGQCL
jgi:hypothetical protein